MGEHKYNPTAIKAKEGKLEPKRKPSSSKRSIINEILRRYGLR